MGSWGVTFAGDRNNELAVFDFLTHIKEKCATHDISHDDLLRHVKLLLFGYSEIARDKLLNYRQTEGQTIGMFLAYFEQLEGYLPQPLAFADKLTAIRRNILPYYQDRLWDKRVNSLDELYQLCRELDATKFNIDRHRTTQAVKGRVYLMKISEFV
jgi:hypothetical protein